MCASAVAALLLLLFLLLLAVVTDAKITVAARHVQVKTLAEAKSSQVKLLRLSLRSLPVSLLKTRAASA